MANIKSQIKRNRTNEKARMRNKSVKSSLKTAVRHFREAADAGDQDGGQGRQQGRHPPQSGRQQEIGHGPASELPIVATAR